MAFLRWFYEFANRYGAPQLPKLTPEELLALQVLERAKREGRA
jgi:hypothetical protein